MAERQSVPSRALALSTYFLSGLLSVNLSQLLGTPLKLIDQGWYNAWIAFTKQSFGLLTVELTHAFAPTTVIVSGDASVRGQMRKKADGSLNLEFPSRIVMIANHQIYTDWLYLWWIAYCNKTHGYLYIVLKESLKQIPIVGWGMQLSQFIFLKRNWEQDKPRMAKALQRLTKSTDPMWLLLFPEGTNLARDTRQKSSVWAVKSGIPDCKHLLLPRSTGLRFCLNQLNKSVNYLYDCTIVYEGVQRDQYAQDIFTLKAGYLEGRPPKSVSMYWRRFAIKDIPTHDEALFSRWLIARWREKDLLLENYHRFGRFPADNSGTLSKTSSQQGKFHYHRGGCGRLEVPIKSNQWHEFLQIFAPMGILGMILFIFYGNLPQSIWNSTMQEEAVQKSANEVRNLIRQHYPPPTRQQASWSGSGSRSFNLDSFFDKTKQTQTFRELALHLAHRLQTPEASAIINRADLVQRWLSSPQSFVSDNNLEGELSLPNPNNDNNNTSKNFLERLNEEEQRRKQSQGRHKGTFWKDLEGQAARRSRANDDTTKNHVTSTSFSKTLTSSQSRERNSTTRILPAETQSRSFWSDLQREERSRKKTKRQSPSQM